MCDRNSSTTTDATLPDPPAPSLLTVADPTSEDEFESLVLADSTTSTTPTQSTLHKFGLLPQELMAEIFATTCHANSYTFSTDLDRYKRTTPLTLGKVCTHWRAVTWSTPYIWSHISLCLSTPRYETQVELLSDWLARSGICPLTINLIFDCEDDWTDTVPIDLIQLLIASANRWRAIHIVLPESWYAILDELEYSFPHLVSVVSEPLWADCSLSLSKRKRLNLFGSAPLLRDVHLNGYYLSDVDIPWGQLNRFTLQYVYLDECFYALVKTPNITFCRISTILINDVNRNIIESPIELPLLHELIIYNASLTDTSRLLAKMTVPSLETLEISAPRMASEPITFASFLCEPKCHLKRLRLTKWPIIWSEPGFVQHLRIIPSLEELHIKLQPFSLPITELVHDILKLAKSNSSDPSGDNIIFLPNLQIFKFSGPITVRNDDYDDRLTSLIERRVEHSKRCSETSPVSRLKVFEVITEESYPFTPSPSVKQRLSKLVIDEGLRLKVKFSESPWL